MNEEQIRVIRERLKKATPGPWCYSPERETHDSPIHRTDAVETHGYIGPEDGGVVGSSEWIWLDPADGEFIAHARQDIEDLLAEVCQLRKPAGTTQ